MEPRISTSVFGVEVEMQLFTLSITDLITFESVPHEEWAEKEDLFEIGIRFARAMLAAKILIFVTEACAWQFSTKLE
jgi:hypothetical protein